MKPISCTLLLFLSALVIAQDGEKKSDLDRMQGAWVVVSLTELGKAIPAAETEVLEFVIDKDVFTVTEKGKTVVQYKVAIDESKTPREINFTHLIGENKDKTEPGIYAFEKEQLKLALDEKRKSRPTVFDGKESETYSVIVLKKKQP